MCHHRIAVQDTPHRVGVSQPFALAFGFAPTRLVTVRFGSGCSKLLDDVPVCFVGKLPQELPQR